MNVDMDSIVVEIESSTKKASEAIDSLISKLNELQTSLSSVGKASNTFKNIGKTITSNTKISPIKNIGLSDQLEKLKVSLNKDDIVSKFTSTTSAGVTTEITKYKDELGNVINVQKKMREGMDDYYRITKKTSSEQTTAFDKFRNSLAGVVTKTALMIAGARKLLNVMLELTETSAEYTEAVNLFYTEMGDKAEEAEKWVKRFSSALYLDPSDVMEYMGAFNSLVSGLGVGVENSYKMSKNLTQLAYDLASYKNISFESAYDKLSSGIAGQIKGLRSVGVALSQNTLQELANELGIQQRITTMDEASKAQLRYIQIMRSSTNWQGDLGKTMMSTENILKSARQQWTLLVRALGDVAAVIIRQVMPYIIALTQLIKEAAISLANFFGLDINFADDFKENSKSVGVNIENIKDGIEDIGDGADKTRKKLNTMLAPFDDLNVVQTKVEKSGSGDSGALSSLGDLPLPEYDALAKLTGEWSGKVEEAKEKIKSIIPIAKKLLEIFGILWLVGKIAKFINNIKTVGSVFNLLKKPLTKVGSLFKTLITRFSDGYKYSQALGGKGLSAILSGTRNLLGPLGKLGITVAGVVASFVTGYKEMKNYAKGNEELSSALVKTTAVTTAFGVAAFALVGWPAALAVGIAGLTGALMGYEQGLHEIEVHNEIFNKKGIEIKALSDGMKVSFDKTAESTLKYANTISDLREKYTNAKSEMDFARQGVDDFMNALLLQDGTISKLQISELKDKYTQLKESTKAARTAHDEYHIALIKSLDEQAGKSAESTAKQIADYKKLQSALKGYEDEYLDAEYELNLKRANGKISQEEYNKEIENLKVAYGLAVPKVWDTTNALNVFNTNLSEIDYKSVEDTNTAIKDVKTSLDKNIKAVEEYRDGVKKQNDEEIASYKEKMTNLELAYGGYDKLSGKQKEIYDTNAKAVSRLEKETADVTERSNKTIEEMQSSYKGYMEGIYADLVSKGADTSKEFKGTINTLKEEISGLKNVDASGIGKKLKDDVIDSIIKNKPAMIANVRTTLASVGGSGGQALEDAFIKQFNESKPKLLKDAEEKLGKPAAKGATDGLNKGVTENKKSITDAGQKLGDYLINGSRQSLGWHSPSTVYEQAGKDIILGLSNGLSNNKKQILDTMTKILTELNQTTTKTLKGLKFEINVSTFQNSLDKLLGKLQTFSNKFRSGVNSLMSSFTTSMNGIKVTSDNKITYTKMPNISIPRFDEGGYPDNASLYWMNENGIPEMLGNVGNKTAVVNNDQIITAMTNAMVSALSGMTFGGQGTTVVNIGNKKVYEGMGEYLDGENERYGTSYVNI